MSVSIACTLFSFPGFKALLQMDGIPSHFYAQETVYDRNGNTTNTKGYNARSKGSKVLTALPDNCITSMKCDLVRSSAESEATVVDIQVKVKSPTLGHLPMFDVAFGTNDSISWLDINITNNKDVNYKSKPCKYSTNYMAELSQPLTHLRQHLSFLKITSTEHDILLLSFCEPSKLQATFSFKLEILMTFPFDSENLGVRMFYMNNFGYEKLVPVKLCWGTDLIASSGHNLYLASLPGTFQRIVLTNLERVNSTPAPRILVSWLSNNYENHMHIEKKIIRNDYKKNYLKHCNIREMAIDIKMFNYCYNFSTDSERESTYYIFFRQLYVFEDYKTVPYNMSWNEASTICEEMGGHLPILRSKEELEALVAMVKVSTFVPAVKAIFIGLTNKGNSQVK